MIPLFGHYPKLGRQIQTLELGLFPTPIQRLDSLSDRLGINLHVKRDDKSGKDYGGNKVRKLEFILADALGKKTIITFGAAGSNHATATAVYSAKVGIQCVSLLIDQPNAQYVRDNLLLQHLWGAELHNYDGFLSGGVGTAFQYTRSALKGQLPLVIPPGGSNLLGTLGYVNAAFELKQQIDDGVMPEPDFIYLPIGTMGTTVGLAIGLAALRMKTKIVPIRILDTYMTNMTSVKALFNKTNNLLRSRDESFPKCAFDVTLRDDFFGDGYALFSDEAREACQIMGEEGINLDGTYTGKAFAAVLGDARKLQDKVVLFWNTYSSARSDTSHVDYKELPEEFHKYFEMPVQTL